MRTTHITSVRPVAPVTSDTPSLSLVVPVYNEEARVVESGPVLIEFAARLSPGSELIFVDDGSTDRTVPAIEELRRADPDLTRLLRCRHRGKGAAVRAGLLEAAGEYGGFTDIDLSAPVDQLQVIFKAATMAPVLAIGSRDLPTSQLPQAESRLRELLGKTYNRLVQLALLPGVADTQCGAKFASMHVWKAVLAWSREDGFAWDVEALAIARRLGIPVQEVGIEWWHDERSRVRVGPDGVRMLKALPRIVRRIEDVPLARPGTEVFDQARAATLIESDSDHWWFRCKAVLATAALRRHLPLDLRDKCAIDLGAGAGGVTASLGWRPDRLLALEGSEELCHQAHDRHSLTAVAAHGEHMPIRDGGAGVIMALDVIEHLEHPELVLDEARRVLDRDGLLIVNVPAHEWLWSGADELLGHVRRYTRPVLRDQLESAGFRVLWMSHVFSWLVPPAWVRRRLTADAQQQLGLDDTSPILDRVAMLLTALERRLVQVVPLPFGTSILAVSRKRAPEQQMTG